MSFFIFLAAGLDNPLFNADLYAVLAVCFKANPAALVEPTVNNLPTPKPIAVLGSQKPAFK